MLKFQTVLSFCFWQKKIKWKMNRNVKKLLLMLVKVLGWENYFPLLVISPWFSYSERGYFIHSRESGQKYPSIGSAILEGRFLIVFGWTPITVFWTREIIFLVPSPLLTENITPSFCSTRHSPLQQWERNLQHSEHHKVRQAALKPVVIILSEIIQF